MTKSKREPSRARAVSDPLAFALLPPPNESPIERELRLKRENEARKKSEGIDEMLRQERIQKKKAKSDVNVLLLGQSESGKSTTLKREYHILRSFNLSLFCTGVVIWSREAGWTCVVTLIRPELSL